MSNPAVEADLILHNGDIWCGMDDGRCAALALWQGRVLVTGGDADILALRGTRTEVVDLAGRFATPGLNDDHLHLMSLGISMQWVDASSDAVPALKALQDALADRAAQTPGGGWIMERG